MRNLITTIALAAAAAPALAQAPDPTLARNLAATCANCHGTNGVTRGSDVEPLAGGELSFAVLRVNAFLATTHAGSGAFLFQLFEDVVHGVSLQKVYF